MLNAWRRRQGVQRAQFGRRSSTEPEDELRARLRAACGADDALLGRVAPYHALLREDLRGDPLVFLPGSLYVTQALDRRSSGTYYTPRALAEEVVRHALDPVVYDPGPGPRGRPRQMEAQARPRAARAEGLPTSRWAQERSSSPPAATSPRGSSRHGPWRRSRRQRQCRPAFAVDVAVPADPIEREALAHRLVAERCLYGVDKNPMAVEMAKLSLWLITLARDRPFSFVDHALRCGDSLLGITDLRPTPRLRTSTRGWHAAGEPRPRVRRDRGRRRSSALELRRELEAFRRPRCRRRRRKAAILGRPTPRSTTPDYSATWSSARRWRGIDDGDPLASDRRRRARYGRCSTTNAERARADGRATQLRALADDVAGRARRAVGEVEATSGEDRRPFHWALEFPEVREQGGFDAIVGNPPFQGGRRSAARSAAQYRDYLVAWLAEAPVGTLTSLRTSISGPRSSLRPSGRLWTDRDQHDRTGGHTRGRARPARSERLDVPPRDRRAQPWPGGANLEMATVWARRDHGRERACSTGRGGRDHFRARRPRAASEDNAARSTRTGDESFNGPMFLGKDSCCRPDEAASMLAPTPATRDVVRPVPHRRGSELSSGRLAFAVGDRLPRLAGGASARVSQSHSRRVERLVRPERACKQRARRPPAPVVAVRASARRALPRYRSARPLHRDHAGEQDRTADVRADWALCIAQRLVVFALRRRLPLRLLSERRSLVVGGHARARRCETESIYTPTDCFETFPQPELTDAVGRLGGELECSPQSALMLDRQEGLTKTYNRVHDPDDTRTTSPVCARLHVAARLRGPRRLRLDGPRPRPRLPRDEVRDAVHVRAGAAPGGARSAARAEPRALRRGGPAGSARKAEGEAQGQVGARRER